MIKVCIVLINMIAFLLFGMDKKRAREGRWRIPEGWLLLAAFSGGAAGALSAMIVFHHKTRKWKFRILVPSFLILQIFAAFMIAQGT